jgi:hypothetical protein
VIRSSSAQLARILLEEPAQLEPFAKALDKPYPTEVGKMAFLEGKMDFWVPLRMTHKNTLLGAFVRQHFCRTNDNFLHSENSRLA